MATVRSSKMLRTVNWLALCLESLKTSALEDPDLIDRGLSLPLIVLIGSIMLSCLVAVRGSLYSARQLCTIGIDKKSSPAKEKPCSKSCAFFVHFRWVFLFFFFSVPACKHVKSMT